MRWIYFWAGTPAANSLDLMQKKLELPSHKLIMDVATRWNSTFDMLQRYVEQQAAMFAAIIDVKKNVKDIVTLSDDDVSNIEKVLKILKPLKTLTTMMCSQKHPSISLIHPLKEMILTHLEPLPTDNKLVSGVKKTISADLKPRYTDENTLAFVHQASALDPRFKSLPYLDDASRLKVYDSLTLESVKYYSQFQSQDVTVKQEPDDEQTAVPTLPQIPTEEANASSTDEDGQPPVKVNNGTSS